MTEHEPHVEPDRLVTLAVVIVLGLLALATVVGGIVLSLDDKSLDTAIVAIGSAAAGSVATILVRGR